jgi:serine/threonine protein kinase
MAKKLKAGDVIRGYEVTKVFGPGMMAISYGALAPDGRKVFLKQYKSPAPSVVWYPAFVDYQDELGSRIRRSSASRFAVAQVDAFEEQWGGRCYFQAFEFVENGDDLQKIIEAEAEEHRRTGSPPVRNPATWNRHVTWAKVLLAAISALHESKIAHADLKPANIYLIRDETIAVGYQLKLIDMDFSVLTDRRAPWHGHQGYVGSDNYRSPEHITRGQIPNSASDVFTCGLILYELLAGHHPYWSEDQREYAASVMAYRAARPRLAGHIAPPASNAAIADALHRCLSPDPLRRPAAAELRAVLSGRLTAPAAHDRAASPSSDLGGLTSEILELRAANGRSMQVRVRTELSKALMQQFGDDSQYWDSQQCLLDRNGKGQWLLAPVGPTTNETLLNGQAVSQPVLLKNGDVLAVGRQAKGVVKLPLTIHGR